MVTYDRNHNRGRSKVDYITVGRENDEGLLLNVGLLFERLKGLADARHARGKRYSLALVLVVIILGKLSGEDTPYGIAEWARMRRAQLAQAFALKRVATPGHNTIRRVLGSAVEAAAVEREVQHFLHEAYGGQQSILVVLDGKTLRGTIATGQTQGLHLLAAYLPSEGVVLLQVAVESKENEISAAPRLLASLDLRGRVVCGDAMFTQRNLSVDVLAQGADYIWFLKENQPQLLEDATQFFVAPRKAPGWHATPLPQEMAQTSTKGHGRLEVRTLTVIPDEGAYLDWPGLQQVFKLERRVTHLRSGTTRHEVVYGITSLSPHHVSAHQLLDWTRAYWGIENGLHYRRDKTLQEDATRMSNRRQAHALAVINNFVVGLSKTLGFDNLAAARRFFNAKLDAHLLNIA